MHFTCLNHLLVMMFGQLSNRDYRIFEDFAFYMMKEVCEKRISDILNILGKKYVFDSTTISICFTTFSLAEFRRKKSGVKVHVFYNVEAQIPKDPPYRLVLYYLSQD